MYWSTTTELSSVNYYNLSYCFFLVIRDFFFCETNVLLVKIKTFLYVCQIIEWNFLYFDRFYVLIKLYTVFVTQNADIQHRWIAVQISFSTMNFKCSHEFQMWLHKNNMCWH